MRLIDDTEYWAGAITANFVIPDHLFWSAQVDQAVQEFKRARDRDQAAALDSANSINFIDFFKRVEAWRKSHREVCRPSDSDCTCKSVGNGWFDLLVEDHVESIFGWASLTDEERARQIEWLRNAAVSHLSKRRRTYRTPALVAMPACNPAERLITSLTRAPGAPPALPHLQQTEGYLAAA